MKFQIGDHVLWWGKRAKVELFGEIVVDSFCIVCEGIQIWVLGRTLELHQRPWAFDKNLNGWVPA